MHRCHDANRKICNPGSARFRELLVNFHSSVEDVACCFSGLSKMAADGDHPRRHKERDRSRSPIKPARLLRTCVKCKKVNLPNDQTTIECGVSVCRGDSTSSGGYRCFFEHVMYCDRCRNSPRCHVSKYASLPR